jgi:outer membrane protein OmpA-like peptidoglycan-associated protein
MVLALVLPNGCLHCQPSSGNVQPSQASEQSLLPQWKFGLFGHGVANVHWANFPSSANGVSGSCCPPFRNGLGVGASLGAMVEFPIPTEAEWLQADWIRNRLWVALRGGWYDHSAAFTVAVDSVFRLGGIPVQGRVEQTLDATLHSGGGEALLHYVVGNRSALMRRNVLRGNIFAGVRFGVFNRRVYTHSRTLVEQTQTARWANGFATDTVAFGAPIPNLQALAVDAALSFGFQLEIPLDPQGWLLLVPEMLYSHPLTDIVPNRGWSHSRLSAGLGLKMAVYEPPEPPPPVIEPLPPAPRPPKPLTARVVARVLDSTGKVVPDVDIRIRVEEFITRRVFPLLMNVFFDERSDRIPERYKLLGTPQEAARFRTSAMAHKQDLSSLQVYYNLLNVLGERMNAKPSSSITLTGCLGSVGFGPESEDNERNLAFRRAEAVRTYLRTVWGIDTARMRVVERGLPEQASRSTDMLGMALNVDEEENRRVEISSDDWDVLKPVLDDDTVRVTNYPQVQLIADIEPKNGLPASVKAWSMRVEQELSQRLGQTLGQTSGQTSGQSMLTLAETGRRDNSSFTYIWQSQLVPPERDAAVIATLNVEAANGTRITTQTWLDVEYLSVQKKRFERLADKEFSTFRFIGFDLGNAAATARHKRIINEYVLPLVGKQATIAITGHTDAVGDDAANVRLSRARAESISQAIGIGNRTVKGVGGSVLLYPNDTPEGRMYSRTVEIQVINPVQR